MKYIKRHMEKQFSELNKEYPAVLITGSRQVGKTTMLEKLIKEEGKMREYVSLDDLNERDMAKNDPKMFLQIHKPPVCIDEVQYAPELFTYIKIHVDKHHDPGDFWLTGSPIFRLMKGVQESLAGRIAILHLSPLSQQEICSGSDIPFRIDTEQLKERHNVFDNVLDIFEKIYKGGMPALVNGKYENSNIFYSSYIETYLERDVRELSGAIDSLKFFRFITAAATRTSQLVNYKAIADDCDMDQVTVKAWLSILETLGIIFYLHPYSNNVLKRTIKTPKLYFYDTGLVCYLTKWSSPETAMAGAMSGTLVENYVISEIIKSYHNSGLEPYIYYYRDKDGKEIDIVMERDGILYPAEIKKTAMPDKRLTRVFNVLDKPPIQRGMGAVICMSDKLNAFDSNNLIVPVGML